VFGALGGAKLQVDMSGLRLLHVVLGFLLSANGRWISV
jgi:hypothetical protein